MGRPSTYEPDTYPVLARQYARDGKTDEGIAAAFGINVATLYKWKNKYSELSNALKEGKHVVDAMVESQLFKRAMGYEFDEITEEYIQIGQEKTPATKTKMVRKQIAPDVTAQIFWLKNRKPGEWRDKQEVDHGNITIEVKLPEDFKGWCHIPAVKVDLTNLSELTNETYYSHYNCQDRYMILYGGA